MKIVQTFWSGNKTTDTFLQNNGGWLSAEYHWLSWALSVLQLRQSYDDVTLVTDALGKRILIDTLQLPYTSVAVVLDDALADYPQELWALAKIYAYSIQNEPFIHIDGDVYIWKRFDNTIENAALIAQNLEIDFPFYHAPIAMMSEDFFTEKNISNVSANAGVIGGHEVGIFTKQQRWATELLKNQPQLLSLDFSSVNMFLEQFLFKMMADEHNIAIIPLFEPQHDPTYPNYADFHLVPEKVWYIHAMAEYKRKPEVCHHLARRLRQDHAAYYYRIIDACLAEGMALDWQCYPLARLDTQWQEFYTQDKQQYLLAERLFAQPKTAILATQLQFSSHCHIEEIESPTYGQVLHYPDITQFTFSSQTLDSLNIVLLDAFQEQNSIATAIEAIKPYFNTQEIAQNPAMFEGLVLARVKDMIFLGVLS